MKSIRRLLSRLHPPPSTEEDDDDDEDEVGDAKAVAAAVAKSVAATRDAAERGGESFDSSSRSGGTGGGGSSFDSRPSVAKGSRRKQRAASRNQRSMEKDQLAKRSLGKRLLSSLQWMHIREDVPSRRQRSKLLQSMASPESIQIWKNNLRSSVMGVEGLSDCSPYLNTGYIAVPRPTGRYMQGSSLSLRPSTRVPIPLGYINEEKSSMRIMRSSSRTIRPHTAPSYVMHDKTDIHPPMTQGGRTPPGGWTQIVGFSEEYGTSPPNGMFTKSSATVKSIMEESQTDIPSGKVHKTLSPRRGDGLRREREKKVTLLCGDNDLHMPSFIGNKIDSSPEVEEGRVSSPSGRKKTCISIVDETRKFDPSYLLDQSIEESGGRSMMKRKYERDEDDKEDQVPFSSIMKRSIRPNDEKQRLRYGGEKSCDDDIEEDKRISNAANALIMRANETDVTGRAIIKYSKGYTKQDKARSAREAFGIEKHENRPKSELYDDIRVRAMRHSANKAKALIHNLEEEGMSRRAAVKAILEHQKQEDRLRYQRERPSHDGVDVEENTDTYNDNDEELKIMIPSNKTSTIILRMEEEGVTGRATVKSIMDQMKQQEKIRLVRDSPSNEKNESRDSVGTYSPGENEEEVKIRIPSNKASTIIIRTEDDSPSRVKSATEQMKQIDKIRLSRENSSHERTEEREKSDIVGKDDDVEEKTKTLSKKSSPVRQVVELKSRTSLKSCNDQKSFAERVRSVRAALEGNGHVGKSEVQSTDEDRTKQRHHRNSVPDIGSGEDTSETPRKNNEHCLVDAFIRESVLQSEKRLAEEYPKTLDDYLNIPIREAGKKSWSRIKAKYTNNTERHNTVSQRRVGTEEKPKKDDIMRESPSSKREKNYGDAVSSAHSTSPKGKRTRRSPEATSPVPDVVHRPRIPLSSIGRLSSEDSENEEWDQIFDAPPKIWAGLHASTKPPRF